VVRLHKFWLNPVILLYNYHFRPVAYVIPAQKQVHSEGFIDKLSMQHVFVCIQVVFEQYLHD
jgi:hypothetical protein